MQFFIDELQSRVNEWRQNGYEGVYEETEKILAYLDESRFLYEPQREALETYIYLKEVLNNASIQDVFLDFVKDDVELLKVINISNKALEFWDDLPQERKDKEIKDRMEEIGFFDFSYTDYIFALTMGAGKTILMGVLMCYEFIISYHHSDDKRFAKNLIIIGPADTTIVEVLKEVKTFDYNKVMPMEYVEILNMIKFCYLDSTDVQLTLNGNYNVVVSNSSKVILRNWKAPVSDKNAFLDLRKDPVNRRLRSLERLEDLIVFVDEAHHAFGDAITKSFTQSRETIKYLSEKTNIVTVSNFTGTPYVNNRILTDTVYMFGLKQGMDKGILKIVKISNHGSVEEVQSEQFVYEVLDEFWKDYGENRFESMLPKIAFYSNDITMLEDLEDKIDKVMRDLNISPDKKLVWHSTYTGDRKKYADVEFGRLDTPESNKQIILLVNKGQEGWNCRSLFAVALYRKSNSKNFVLQSSCRCLRRIGDNATRARVFLSGENYKMLDKELQNSFNTDIMAIDDRLRIEFPVEFVEAKEKKAIRGFDSIETVEFLDNVDYKNVKIDLKKVYVKDTPSVIQQTEVVVSGENNVEYKMAKDVKRKKIEVDGFMDFYFISSYIQDRTHLSFTEVNEIFDNNAIGREELSVAVSGDNGVLDSVVDQILEQSTSYEYRRESIECEFHLTKNFPHKRIVKRLSENETEEALFRRSLILYQEAEEKRSGFKSNIGFHIDPYDFDSNDEQDMFRFLRKEFNKDEKIKDVYFVGGITFEKYNDFFFEYQKNINTSSSKKSKYFPDFVIETNKDRYFVIEVKSGAEKETYNLQKRQYEKKQIHYNEITSEPLMKEIGFNKFKDINKNFFYKIIFNSTEIAGQQEALEFVRDGG